MKVAAAINAAAFSDVPHAAQGAALMLNPAGQLSALLCQTGKQG
jgi:hypothetical protein